MNWEEKWKKETVERTDDIASSIKSLEEAMEYIEESCELCGRCKLTKSTCEVAKSYKKIENVKEELESFQCKLEDSIRRGESI